MSTAKGYVVRGKCDGREVRPHRDDGAFSPAATSAATFREHVFESAGGASGAFAHLTRCGCTDVRILAVAEDGTETPLPSYEEALAQLSRITEGTAGIGFAGPEDRATDRVDLLLASRDAIARERDEARASHEAERKAWARFYVASENVFVMAIGSFGEGRDLAPERAKREAAREALRALGVDVDTLLKEADR
jgi:hypothetical protein